MDVTPLIPAGKQVIQSYGPEGFRVGGKVYPGAVIVTPEKVLPWDHAGPAQDLRASDFAALAQPAGALDVVLIGCGARQIFLGPALRAQLKAMGLNAETMDTGAACRTYNVLMAEGRRVAACLLPLGKQTGEG